MKYVCMLIIVLVNLSCKSNKALVSLSIVNETLSFNNRTLEDGMVYKDSMERSKSYNVLKYRLTNNSKKKYLFYLRSIDFSEIAGLQLTIKDGNRVLNGSGILPMYALDGCKLETMTAFFKNESQDRSKLKELGFGMSSEYAMNYLTQTVIIQPGESFEFSTILSLPIVVEANYLKNTSPKFFTLENKRYSVSIRYQINNDSLIIGLPEKELRQLNNNGVEIFTGILDSNEVDLVPIK